MSKVCLLGSQKKKQQLLSAKHKAACVQWATARAHWTHNVWSQVWSDKHKFNISGNCIRTLYVCHLPMKDVMITAFRRQ